MCLPTSRRTLLGAALAVPFAFAGTAEAGPPRVLAIRNVTVIDVEGAARKPGRTILISGGRITVVGRVGEVPVPPSATVVDGTGRFLIPGLCDMHVHSFPVIIPSRTAEERERHRVLLERGHALVGEMAAAGVPILAGTDAGDVPFVVPGFALHDELEALVDSGISPLAALRAATSEPGRFLGDGRGRIREGADADLVLLDADPVTDIRNTRRIAGVVSRGELLDPAALLESAADSVSRETARS